MQSKRSITSPAPRPCPTASPAANTTRPRLRTLGRVGVALGLSLGLASGAQAFWLSNLISFFVPIFRPAPPPPPPPPPAPKPVANSALPAVGPGYTQTRYPVVLIHGLTGYGRIGPIDYFYGVPAALRKSGAVVYAPSVSAFNSNEARGEQLLQTLKQLRAAHGYTKFNLIGHSQGGPTARYVAAAAPDMVASVSTVGSPHQGSPTADTVGNIAAATGTTGLLSGIANLFGNIISFVSGAPSLPQNSLGSLESLQTAGAQRFNQRFPQAAPSSHCGSGAAVVKNVRYYSVGGTSVLTNVLDPFDAALGIASLSFRGEANDGLVGRCSSHWGMVLRDDYPWNHMDEANQSFGLRNGAAPDPVQFYRSHVNRLKLAGL